MTAQSNYSRREILHIRHHSLFTPRDFDLSPYFRVVKPTLEYGFDYKKLTGTILHRKVNKSKMKHRSQSVRRPDTMKALPDQRRQQTLTFDA